MSRRQDDIELKIKEEEEKQSQDLDFERLVEPGQVIADRLHQIASDPLWMKDQEFLSKEKENFQYLVKAIDAIEDDEVIFIGMGVGSESVR